MLELNNYKKMPNIGQDINWIPVDIFNTSLVDLALKSSFDISTSADQRVYHLRNPHSTTYQDYFKSLREAGLHSDTVSLKVFLDIILTTNDLTNPIIKLSSFFEQIYRKKDTSKTSEYKTVKTVRRCEILKNSPTTDLNLIKLYLNYWTTCQLFELD
jgi:hypothetical protein